MVEDGDYKDRFERAMRHSRKDTHAIASDLDISYQAVMKVRNGLTRMLKADHNAIAAKAMGVCSDWLATGEGSMLSACEATVSDRSAFVAAQLDAIADPSDRDRATILCETFAALAQAGQLDSAIRALQAMAPAQPAALPSEPQPQSPRQQTAGARAGRA